MASVIVVKRTSMTEKVKAKNNEKYVERYKRGEM